MLVVRPFNPVNEKIKEIGKTSRHDQIQGANYK